MRTLPFFLLSFLSLLSLAAQARLSVEDFRRSDDPANDAVFINRAMRYLDSAGHGCLQFDGSKTYRIQSPIQLPAGHLGKKYIFIIEGDGCRFNISKGVNAFERMPKHQKQAHQFITHRFMIRNFTFYGGKRGIFLGATYGSKITDCNFIGQQEAAVEVQFGLQTTISNCQATNCLTHAFVLTYGEAWKGGFNASQSNHSVIESCKVFARDGAVSAFKVIASDGVVLRDNISEGSKNIRYSVFFHKRKATTVKMFRLENFHLEHAPSHAAVYIYSSGISTVDGLFYQLSRDEMPLVHAGGDGQITLKNIPWFVSGTVIRNEGKERLAWRMEFCDPRFYKKTVWQSKEDGIWTSKFPRHFSARGGMRDINKEYGTKH